MHGIQTSGNCIRNITADQFAGVAPDEIVDPRPWAEILRQWSTFHPEFAWLPRKFKIAVSASKEDRAAVQIHDLGVYLKKNAAGRSGRRAFSRAAASGRTPIVGAVIREDLPWQHLLTYCEAVLRVYNRYGRRDNMYKARIKILVKALSPEKFAEQVEEEWQHLKDGPSTLTQAEARPRVAVLRSRRSTRSCRTRTRRTKSICSKAARSRAGSSATCVRTRCRATRR